MPTILVNGAAQGFDQGHETWGHLLEQLDRQLAAQGQVVTMARLDGVEEPTFREPDVTAKPLAGMALVEIESAPPAVLASRSLRDAVAALESLTDASLEIADGFRGHDIAAANRSLVDLANGLRMLATLVGAVSLALRTDSQRPADSPEPVGDTVVTLGAHLQSLIEAQRNSDWVTVADVLQFDIEPNLREWRSGLESFLTALPQ